MIVITGGVGFIGSVFLSFLNEKNIRDTVLIDDFSKPEKFHNLSWKYYGDTIDRKNQNSFLENHAEQIQAIVHLGSKAGYLHSNWEELNHDIQKNFKDLWRFCTKNRIPLIYASSASVYGSGEHGFKDDIETALKLSLSHPYSAMKAQLDIWALQQSEQPPFWAGLRMPNVYGPNEYHKKANASLIFKAYNQILMNGKMKLFASDRSGFEDGGMLRDYIYVKDVAKVIWFLLDSKPKSGIYNVGTGRSVSFKEAVSQVFYALEQEPVYEFEPIREELKDSLPYEIYLDIDKLKSIGYHEKFYSIEEGVRDYVLNYLKRGEFY